jgi:hypothetical protein
MEISGEDDAAAFIRAGHEKPYLEVKSVCG